MSEEWWHPREIYFGREQCIWIIAEVFPLGQGNWPINPKGSGYVDEPIGQKSHRQRAPFETPCQITAEIMARLETTKEAGEALVDEIQSGIIYYDLLSRPAKRALNYISGWKRRRQSFSQWKKQNKVRRIIPNK